MLTVATCSRCAAPGALRRGPAAAGAGAAVRGSRRARRAAARKGASEAAAPATASPPGDSARLHPVIPAALLTLPVAFACSRSLALAARPVAPAFARQAQAAVIMNTTDMTAPNDGTRSPGTTVSQLLSERDCGSVG